MGKVNFIDTTGAKQNTQLDSNISDKSVSLLIKIAEDIYLQELIGTELFVKLQNNISGDTLTSVQRTLITDYILNYLYATVDMLAIDELLVKINQAGVNSSTPPNTLQKSKDELLTVKMHKEKVSNFYGGLVKTYINNNINELSEYNTFDNGVPSKKYNTFGFYCDDNDFVEDDMYNNRTADNNREESI